MFAQLLALRAQVEALVAQAEAEMPQQAPAANTVETCPNCGASGETQQVVPTMSGSTNVFCRECKQKRVVGGPQP